MSVATLSASTSFPAPLINTDKDPTSPSTPPLTDSEQSLASYYAQRHAERLASNQRHLERALLLDSTTAIFTSILQVNLWSVKFLCESDDAVLTARTSVQQATPLMVAVSSSRSTQQLIDMLIGFTIDVSPIDSVDAYGATALMYAVRAGRSNWIDTLILCGASPAHVDNNGLSVLQYATDTANSSLISKIIHSLAHSIIDRQLITDRVLLCKRACQEQFQAPVVMHRQSIIMPTLSSATLSSTQTDTDRPSTDKTSHRSHQHKSDNKQKKHKAK